MNHQAAAIDSPTPMAPAQPHTGTRCLRAQTTAAPSQTRPKSRAPPWPMPLRAIRSRGVPPSIVHHSEITCRSGDSAPVNAACAVTAKIRPESSERRLPCAANTSRRLEQPRARIMPMPNSAPPMAAPERLPRVAIWRALPASNQPAQANAWVATTVAENANSHTVNLPPVTLRANSITAERRQKRERCARKPKATPMSMAPAARLPFSPNFATTASNTLPVSANRPSSSCAAV